MVRKNSKRDLTSMYDRLYSAFGPQHWWPGETSFEVIVGAILTQNTNWANVEQAIKNIKRAGLLDPQGLQKISLQRLSQLIKPSGYFNVKAKRLKNLLNFLFAVYDGNIQRMAGEKTDLLRQQLLSVQGIGPETADSILLYALQKPTFVVDAYTRRVLFRHGLIEPEVGYTEIQRLFMENLYESVSLFNEFHALIVRLGKEYCRPRPKCELCPLKTWKYSLQKRCAHCFRIVKDKEILIKMRLKEGRPKDLLCSRCRKDSKQKR